MSDSGKKDMSAREEFADSVLKSTINRAVRQEKLEASLKQGFDEMPSDEAFSTHEPGKAMSCAHRLLSAAPFLVACLAYMWAQATARGVDSITQFVLEIQTACLNSPERVVDLVRNGLRASGRGQLSLTLTAAELLNVFGGTVALLCVHNWMRTVFVKLVQRSRRTQTLFDDIAFGACLIMFPRAHVIFDPAEDQGPRSENAQRGRSRISEQLPLTLRFASVGDDTVRSKMNDPQLSFSNAFVFSARSPKRVRVAAGSSYARGPHADRNRGSDLQGRSVRALPHLCNHSWGARRFTCSPRIVTK